MTKEDIRIIRENKLSINEFFFLKGLYNQENNINFQIEFNEYYKYLIAFHEKELNQIIQSLSEKEYIFQDENNKDEVSSIILLDKVKSLFILDKDVLWKEVLKAYPVYGYINNKKINLQMIKDDKIKNHYFNNIVQGNKKKHNDAISIIKSHFKDKLEESPIPTISSEYGCIGIEKFLNNWNTFVRVFFEEQKVKTWNR